MNEVIRCSRMPFSFKTAFKQGFSTFKCSYSSLLGGAALFIVITLGVALVQYTINEALGLDTSNQQKTAPDLLIALFFTNVFVSGTLLLGLLLHRGQPSPLSTLFAGFSRYWAMVGIGFCIGLIVVGSVIITIAFISWLTIVMENVASTAASSAAFGPGIALIILGGIALLFFFITRLFFAGLLCIDPTTQYGITKSISTSWRMTKPIFWPLLGLLIVLILIFCLSFLVFILPAIFFAAPLLMAVLAAAYDLALNQYRAAGLDELQPEIGPEA